MRQLLHLVLNLSSWVFLGALALLGLFIVTTNGTLMRGWHSFVVLSGSMEPAICIGDLIVTHQQAHYYPRDVITFQGADGRLVTHRVMELKTTNGQLEYQTKGDANRSEDDGQVNQPAVTGKVVLVVPKLGRLVGFARSPFGLLTLIVCPLFALGIDQLLKLNHVRQTLKG